MKIAVVTDSTCYLPKEQVEKYNITVVPMPVMIDGKEYHEDEDITTEEFYDKLRTLDELPTTSQPPIGQMVELYTKLGDEGFDTIISIHLASTISGYVGSLSTAAEMVTNTKVIPYDSQITVILMGNLVLQAARMAQDGKDVDEILASLDQMRATMNEVLIVNDLKNLVKGGRLSNASAVIGSVLNIKPLLTFDNQTHEIVAYDKVRSIKKAYAAAIKTFEEDQSKVDFDYKLIVIHANDPEEAENWASDLRKKFPDLTVEISYFGPVIGTHLGEKAIALAWIKDIDK
ncbi:DegV family protein [Lactobacillus sp. YT155]|uniref:DegV family protein n=1 Tax=Lactobacillus sp. YT155 TaxID=3060955 RepID=UPI00265E5F18|nr:DegV family protein [Lactobacillus sp. YT155]MDO1605419.1 DegV family protein [Lactobacillus sp. YT155]